MAHMRFLREQGVAGRPPSGQPDGADRKALDIVMRAAYAVEGQLGG